MARPKRLTLQEVHAALFEEEDYYDSAGSDSGSIAASADSAEEDAFEDGIDVILDM